MFWETLLWSLFIFIARAVDVGMGTMRVQFIVRRKKVLASLIGFVEVIIYILIVSRVIREIGEWQGLISLIPVLAYGGGFALGTLLGITMSEKMNRGMIEVTIITHQPCEEIEAVVRESGFALTRYQGTGREGQVAVLSAVCQDKDVSRLIKTINQVAPKAFVYTRELSGLRGGYIYGLQNKR